MNPRRTVDIIADLRACCDGSDSSHDTSMWLLAEAADRLEHFAWDGIPPRTPHLAAGCPPNAGDVDASADPLMLRSVDAPAVAAERPGGDGGGEVRLASPAMPLAATEFSDGDPTPPHGVVRPVLHRGLYVVTP